MKRQGFGTQTVFFLWHVGIVVAQISSIGKEATSCSGDDFDFNWNYTSGVSIFIVEWTLNSSKIASHNIGGSQPFTPNPGYTTRLTKTSDVAIALSSLSENDTGEYSCSVINGNGNTLSCDPLTLFVFDHWSAVFSISKTGGGESLWLRSSINDDRTSYSWLYKDKEVGSEFQYKAIENGNYTLTLGRRGKCLIGISSSKSILVTEISDCFLDIFLYGFLPDSLIEVIASITIFIILKKECLRKLFGEFTWKKVGITAVFFVIAIIIGVCLGLLIKGCDKKLLALGLSLFFGILLVVALIFALIYYHKKCESGSDIQDGDGGEDSNRSSQNNTGSNTTRTGTGRVGSPASTSNVELAANLNRNKTDVPKGDQSALNQKAWQSPLPLPPVASQPPTASTHNLPLSRNNQLGPIAVENEEANSSEKKKKKKKKKKKRIVDEAEDNENES